MSGEWVTDRAPTYDEVKDHELAYVTVCIDALGKVRVERSQFSGFVIRCRFGCEWTYAHTLVAWYSPPLAWDEQREIEEAAEIIAAMRSGDDAKLRDCLKIETSNNGNQE
jgi:hypothetical protein